MRPSLREIMTVAGGILAFVAVIAVFIWVLAKLGVTVFLSDVGTGRLG